MSFSPLNISRPVTRPPVYGADPKGHAAHRCSRPRPVVRPAVGRPRQRRARLGWERPWRLLHFWRRRGHKVPPQTRHGPDLPCPSGQCTASVLKRINPLLPLDWSEQAFTASWISLVIFRWSQLALGSIWFVCLWILGSDAGLSLALASPSLMEASS